jgi:alanine racemase
MNNLVWIEIKKQAIKHNINTFKKLIGDKTILAPCVKANAYGHGLVSVAKLVNDAGADWLCVNCVDEAEQLRQADIKMPIMIMGYLDEKDANRAGEADARIFVYNLSTAKALSAAANQLKKTIPVHVKVDTGMSRQGTAVKAAPEFIKQLEGMPGLKVEGVCTHFATADEPEKPEPFDKQLNAFKRLVAELKLVYPDLVYHSANSAATLLYPEAHFNLVRPGISIYGYWPSAITGRLAEPQDIELKPSLALKTKVAMVKNLPKGACVSYGCTFVTEAPTRIAVLPIGYYDGLSRKLSNAGEVLIRGQRARILGRVCMNIIMVDVTNINEVAQDDEVVIIGEQGSGRIAVEDIAERADTINYEITTRLRESIPRHYL